MLDKVSVIGAHAIGAAMLALILSGCGAKAAYSMADVEAAFQRQGIVLAVVIGPLEKRNQLRWILGPADASCPRDDLIVNVFSSERSLRSYLERATSRPVRARWRAGTNLNFVQNNLLVGVRTTSKCVSTTAAEAALKDLR